MSAGNKEDSDGIQEESVVKCDDSSTTDSGSALDDESCQGTETVLSTQDADYQVNLLLHVLYDQHVFSTQTNTTMVAEFISLFFISREVVCVYYSW